MKYRKYHLLLDLFGVLGLCLAITYYHYGHLASAGGTAKDDELYNLWGNISTDLIGIWLSVRIIDYVIRRGEKEHSARIGLVRNSRFLVGQTKRAVEFSGRYEADHLVNEIRYTRRIFDKRKQFLATDESADLDAFYSLIEGFRPDLEALALAKDNPGDSSRAEVERIRKSLWDKLMLLQDAQRKAEQNILAESDED